MLWGRGTEQMQAGQQWGLEAHPEDTHTDLLCTHNPSFSNGTHSLGMARQSPLGLFLEKELLLADNQSNLNLYFLNYV